MPFNMKKKGRLSMKGDSNKPSKQGVLNNTTETLQAEIHRLRMENEYLKS